MEALHRLYFIQLDVFIGTSQEVFPLSYSKTSTDHIDIMITKPHQQPPACKPTPTLRPTYAHIIKPTTITETLKPTPH
jgi:hypothetical protein